MRLRRDQYECCVRSRIAVAMNGKCSAICVHLSILSSRRKPTANQAPFVRPNVQDQAAAASVATTPETEAGGSAASYCSAVNASDWGYGINHVKDEDAPNINRKPVDLRWQQTAPKEGHWIKAEDLVPYLGDQ